MAYFEILLKFLTKLRLFASTYIVGEFRKLKYNEIILNEEIKFGVAATNL